jgi:hypothetical protein
MVGTGHAPDLGVRACDPASGSSPDAAKWYESSLATGRNSVLIGMDGTTVRVDLRGISTRAAIGWSP